MSDSWANQQTSKRTGQTTHPPIPDHELIRKIGAGSYGEVWLARNVMGTPRAVKIVFRRTFENDRPYEREFEGIRRCEPISRTHPSQLQILHVGRTADSFYYVMELADNAFGVPPSGGSGATQDRLKAELQAYTPRTLKHELQTHGRLPPAECVQIGLALAEALQHLHSHGLVHRDIKPSNIIFINGVPKLADIGLVTDLDASRSFVGTEGFLPPEGPGTPQADIYSLGKVLYETAMGRSRTDFPALPEDWDALAPAEQASLLELNEVLLRACESDPRKRYPSVTELHSELRSLCQGRSIRQQRTIAKRMRRTKILAITAMALLLVFATLMALVHNKNGMRIGRHSATTNEHARMAYERGKALFNRLDTRTFTNAINQFTLAIEHDPNFLAAYAGLANAYLWSFEYMDAPSFAEFRLIAQKLVSLDQTGVESQIALGVCNMLDGKWRDAERCLKSAIIANSGFALTHFHYAFWLMCEGHFEDALRELKRAEQLEPTAVSVQIALGWPSHAASRYNEAIRQYLKALELEPNQFHAHWWLWHAYEAKGEFLNAITESEQCAISKGASREAAAKSHELLRSAFEAQGAVGYWRAALSKALDEKPTDSSEIADHYAHLGQNDKALDWLEKGLAADRYGLHKLKFHSRFRWAPLRSEPRFLALLSARDDQGSKSAR